MLYLPFNVYLDSKRVSILIEAVLPTEHDAHFIQLIRVDLASNSLFHCVDHYALKGRQICEDHPLIMPCFNDFSAFKIPLKSQTYAIKYAAWVPMFRRTHCFLFMFDDYGHIRDEPFIEDAFYSIMVRQHYARWRTIVCPRYWTQRHSRVILKPCYRRASGENYGKLRNETAKIASTVPHLQDTRSHWTCAPVFTSDKGHFREKSPPKNNWKTLGVFWRQKIGNYGAVRRHCLTSHYAERAVYHLDIWGQF